ncbi:MAG: RHS repeat domain-containing protein [Terriglobales bacterium]
MRVTTTLNDTGQVTKTEWTYESRVPIGSSTSRLLNNVIEQREYEFGAGVAGPLVRKTINSWLNINPVNGQAYRTSTLHILDRKATEAIYDGSGALKAQSQFEYDNYTEGLTATGAVQHQTSFGTSYRTRGNLTASKAWRNTDGAWLTTQYQYDDAGSVRKATDPGLHATTFSYADSWANGACTPVGGSARAYLTSTTNALSHVTGNTYNSCTGSIASSTDSNNQVTALTYDEVGRLRQTNLPGGGQITVTPDDTSSPRSITTSTKITTLAKSTKTDFDGLGRGIQTALLSDPQGAAYADATYDALGRVKTITNPYRSTSESTFGITKTQYDALGRATKVIPSDGTATSNNITTAYAGTTTTVTDQAGKVRKSETDALGRLIRVWEPNSSGSLVNKTRYFYDALDNLTCVLQLSTDPEPANCASPNVTWRPRTFTYNSLSQLTRAVSPEAGTTDYTYDADGNVLTKVAPKPNQTGALTVTTTYTYDGLHRLTQKSYNDGATAMVTYLYDQSSYNGLTTTNGIGRRTGMTDASGVSAFSYDAVGRPMTLRRTLNGLTFNTGTNYTVGGYPYRTYYPSGRVNEYLYGGAGRPVSLLRVGAVENYVENATYAPHGALSGSLNGRISGGFAGFTTAYTYNNRLQPEHMLVTSATLDLSCTSIAGKVLHFFYNFDQDSGAPVVNNGNVVSIRNCRNTNRTQSFTYDELNRIKTAQSQATSGADCWGNSFAYDIWANLLSKTVTKCTAETLTVAVNTNNRITSAGFTYDAVGNMTNAGAGVMTYDAENRLINAAGVNYVYDGDGHRVMKSSGKLYWYEPDGTLIAESDLAGTWTIEHMYFNGKRVARRELVPGYSLRYHFSDHLGSASVVTNVSGTVKDESDYYPYGGERVITNQDPNQYKFTGSERDGESGLDYFVARYHSSNLGRFASPDDPLLDQSQAAPQSWNLYSYVRNIPTRFYDPTGNACVGNEDTGWRDDERDGPSCAEVQQDWATPVPAVTVTDEMPSDLEIVLDDVQWGVGYVLEQTVGAWYGSFIEAITTKDVATFTIATASVVTAGRGRGASGPAKKLISSKVAAAAIKKPLASSPRLAEVVNRLFRAGDKVPGGTATAVRYELETGKQLAQGTWHSQKAQDTITELTRLLKSGELSYRDQQLARELIRDLSNALAWK